MSSEKWQLSNDSAFLYEKYVHPLMAPWVDILVEKANLKEGERVLDVACGTGFVSRLAATKVGLSGQVVGVDLNKSMIVAAQKFANADAALSIEWYEADVSNLPFDDASFEVVLCQQGMPFFPDTQAAIKEIYRVLTPDGRLVFTVWDAIEDSPYFDALAKALGSHLSEQAEDGLRGAFKKSYAVDFKPALMAVGFKQFDVISPVLNFHLPPLEEYLPGHLASLPMASAISALPDSKKTSILNDMCDALKTFTNDDGVVIPSQSEVVFAVKQKPYPVEHFDLVHADAQSWLAQANEHRLSADVIFLEWEKIRGLAPSVVREKMVAYSKSFMLLNGFAVENVLKGIFYGRDPNNKNLRKFKGGHGIVGMAQEVGVTLTSGESDLLDRLEIYLRWAGRYRLPLKPDDFLMDSVKITTNDPLIIKQMFGKFEKILHKEWNTRNND